MPEHENIELRSEEVQEIMSAVPHVIIRWGITLVFALILLLIFLSWLIKYPDTIQGTAVITTTQPPITLVSPATGELKQLFVQNNTPVKKGQPIAEIKNPVQRQTVDSLQLFLQNIDTNLQHIDTLLAVYQHIGTLGNMQNTFNQLYNTLQEYQRVTHDLFYNKSIHNLNRQIEYNNRLAWIAKQEIELLQQEVNNAIDKHVSDSIMYQKGIISKYEYVNAHSGLTHKKQQLINAKKAFVQHKITVTNLIKQKNELEKQHQEKQEQLTQAYLTHLKTLQNELKTWQQNYTLIAPIEGELNYLTDISENRHITAETPLFAVIPDNSNYIAQIKIPAKGYGKVKTGQIVRIQLDNYPYQEYGQLLGKVNNIAKIAGKDGYFLQVRLTNGLTTTYNKSLPYLPNMQGSAQIITDNLRITDRIFNTFRKILNTTK